MLAFFLFLVAMGLAIIVGVLLHDRASTQAELDRLGRRVKDLPGTEAERDQLALERNSLAAKLTRYRALVDAEAERDRLVRECDRLAALVQGEQGQMERDRAAWAGEVAEKRRELNDLSSRVQYLRDEEALQEVGFYRPKYNLSSAQYKIKLGKLQDQIAGVLRADQAAVCHVPWVVDGSEEKGRKMVERILKLQLRAFNGECDAAIAKVSWKNYQTMEDRIWKAFKAINKLGEPTHCEITSAYVELRLEELRLTHEREEKLEEEREEQRRIREEAREEEIARREIEREQERAEREEERWAEVLERARRELAAASDKQAEGLKSKIAELEVRLAEAHANKERAISRAQLTRSGHVYVISNEGSFGQDVYKIGMTRRLDPLDRVRELGDASVPFRFDVHAVIYSEDAPALESRLHALFSARRMNMVNERKEFFRVSLAEIEKHVRELRGEIEFTRVAEAKEYRETLAMLAAREGPSPGHPTDYLARSTTA